MSSQGIYQAVHAESSSINQSDTKTKMFNVRSSKTDRKPLVYRACRTKRDEREKTKRKPSSSPEVILLLVIARVKIQEYNYA